MTQQSRCIILDSQDIPLAHATLESPVDAPAWQLRVLDGGIDAVLEQEYIRIVSMNSAVPAKTGRISRHRGDLLSIDIVSSLGEEVRDLLRVAVHFDSFVYPVTGAWTGRYPVIAQDLSCGGIAFYCAHPLEPGEIVEIVIPITEQPLVLRAQVLRLRPSTSQIQLYSSKFVDLVQAEEDMVCEAVFGQQISNRDNESYYLHSHSTT